MSIKTEPQKKPTTAYTQSALQQDSEKLCLSNDPSHAPFVEKYGRQTAVLTPKEQLEKEIAEREKTEIQLQNRIKFDRLLTTISMRFINLTTDEIDESIDQALKEVADFTGYDRAYIYLLEENGRSLKNTHSWCQQPDQANQNDFKTLPTNLFQTWLPQLLQQESVQVQNIAEAEQETDNAKKVLALQSIHSALIIPLVSGKAAIGYFVLGSSQADPPWQNELPDPFKVMGTIFVNALMRKKTEEALQEERNLAQKIMTTMGQGLMLANVDGALEYVNPQFAEMLGYEIAELLGKTPLDFVHPDDHATLIQAHTNRLAGMATRYEYRVVRADGSLLYVLVSGVPHFDHQGKLIGSIATITDLTERRKAEAKIEANAEEIKMIYKAAIQLFKPSSVQKLAEQIAAIARDELGFDACGVLLLHEPIKLNTDRLTLKSQNTANYLTWLARLDSGSDNGTTVPLMDDGLVATAVRHAEIMYAPDITQDHSCPADNTHTQSELVVPLRAYNFIIGAIDLHSPHKNGFDERAQRIIAVFAEHAGLALETMRLYEELYKHSNELNALNAKLAKALRTKDEFLANMSHELRTPLSAILGKSEIMLEGIPGPLTDKQTASLRVIEESGRHLLDLINDILDIAKIEAGKIALDIQKVPLRNVSEISLQVVRQMAHKKQIKLQVNVPPSLKSVRADERRLKQILINLLSNAVKFTANGGEVGLNISNDPEKESIQFQVWDTGIGISPENMTLLFKPFVQLDSSLARLHEGTGLGLSLVYRLTEMHGGSVSLESQVGVGSCFTVTLPQNPQPDSASLQEQAKTERLQCGDLLTNKLSQGSSEGPLILLVEDNEMSIEMVSEYLPIWGYRLIVARTGLEAVARAQQEKPDLILMDIQISEIDGLTAVQELRQDTTTSSIPIVALTALAIHGDQERCLAAGVNKYLSKPIQLRQLALLIDQLLTGARLKQARQPKVKPTYV